MPRYLEFAVASNFSFLRGASHAEELMLQAAHIGLDGLGLCDRNSVAGVVRAHLIKREQELALAYHPGARLVFADGTPDILAYPRERAAWGRLCRLLTRGNLRAQKGECILYRDDLLEHIDGLELIVMETSTCEHPSPPFLRKPQSPSTIALCAAKQGAPQQYPGGSREGLQLVAKAEKKAGANNLLALLREAAGGRVRLAAAMLYHGNDRTGLARRAALARETGVPLIAINDVLYHHPDRRELQDVLTCIREHLTIDTAGRRLAANAERYLKPSAEMARLFRDMPEAIAETAALDAVLTFSLDELRYEYPEEMRAGFATPQDALVHLAWEGAAARYPDGIPDNVRQSLDHELALIAKLNYAPYFLTVHYIVGYARSQNILCQGRGSAANSAVCYCLRITDVDPREGRLLFERFISSDRGEPPDIDVDFEHERREEVIQHIYAHYGRDHTGIAATVVSYRGRSAIREVGKVFGLSEDTIGALSSSIWGMGSGGVRSAELVRAGIDVNSPRMQKMRALAVEIQSFPRHLSQHVGGFVITRSRLDEVVPIGNGAMADRTFVEWDKDDLDALGILKVDVLGLGMLTCLRKAFELTEKHYGLSFRLFREEQKNGKGFFALSTIPKE
ncbi:MAG TPA: error-prone DNA polymerase, partial [Xanthobacteraceae bacterium]|nr:error-prone DNA polymerase [Xanthobacteraceae bacterium]